MLGCLGKGYSCWVRMVAGWDKPAVICRWYSTSGWLRGEVLFTRCQIIIEFIFFFKISKYIQPNPLILWIYVIHICRKYLYKNHELTCIILDTIAFFKKWLQINHITLITRWVKKRYKQKYLTFFYCISYANISLTIQKEIVCLTFEKW